MSEIPNVAVHEVDLARVSAVHERIDEFDPWFIANYYGNEGVNDKEPYFLVATHNDQDAGYAVCYDRGAETEEPSFHLWLAGVVREQRQHGVFSALAVATEAEAVRRGHSRITVTSFREKFPAMVHTLPRHGFTILSEEVTTSSDGTSSTKVRFSKELNGA